MAELTENYGLTCGLVTDDLIEAEYQNQVAKTLDRVLGNFLKKMMADGAYSGWEVGLDGTVSPGEGLIGGCWCQTATAQSVSGMTAVATNHVFARCDSTSATAGTVSFFAQPSTTRPAGAVFLGSVKVDENGHVTSVDDSSLERDRNCLRLEIGEIAGSGSMTDVAIGASVKVRVEHPTTPFIVPGGMAMVSATDGFSWEFDETWRGDGFVLTAKNESGQVADFTYSWRRCGFVG